MLQHLLNWFTKAHLEEIGVGLLALLLVTTYVWLVIGRRRVKERLKTIEEYRLRQDATYSQASKKLEDLKDKISRKMRGAMIVDIVHDFSDNFFLVDREATPPNITFEQAFEIMNRVRSAQKDGPIVIILHTLGGYSLATEFIASALKRHKGTVKAFVPYVAMSGGTIVALSANEIHLGGGASLGPIDTQYSHYPFSAYEKLVKLKGDETSDFALLNYFEADIREQTMQKRLEDVAASHNREAVQELLNPDLPHDFRVTANDADRFKLSVSTDNFPPEIYAYVETRLIMLRRYNELIIKPAQDQLRDQHPREQRPREPDAHLRSSYVRRMRHGL